MRDTGWGDRRQSYRPHRSGETVLLGGPYTISAVLSPTAVLHNYTITFVAATFSITPKAVTVTANAGQGKEFGAVDPALTYTSSDLSATFSGALHRAVGEALGNYAIDQGTLDNTNYTITFIGADFTITKANQTITVTTHAPAIAVNGSTFTVAATSSSGLAVTFSASGGCTNVGNAFTMTSGTISCHVQYDQAGNSNYNAAPQVVETVLGSNAPVITLQPVNSVVMLGGNATFTAAANGDPAPTVQWQVSTDGVLNFTDMAGETSTTLTIVQPPLATAGYQYRAVFTNDGGSAQTHSAKCILMYYYGFLPFIGR